MYSRAVKRNLGYVAGACLAVCSVAHADETILSPQRLGLVEGIVKFCEAIDKPSADKVHEAIKQATQGASPDQLAELRSSEEYRKAYDSVQGFTDQVDPHNAKKVCSEISKPGG